jgi:apolipoprotein D and lipocalin family protein
LGDGTVGVKNTCMKGKSRSSVYGSAKVTGKDSLAVSFVPLNLDNPFNRPNYKVLYTDYDTSLVGSPDKKYLWVLSRTKKMSPRKYNMLVSIAKRRGYDISKLQKDYAK